jgi:hypothetical protein
MLDVGIWIFDMGYGMPEFGIGSLILDIGCWIFVL